MPCKIFKRDLKKVFKSQILYFAHFHFILLVAFVFSIAISFSLIVFLLLFLPFLVI